jgi:hypothetical protein
MWLRSVLVTGLVSLLVACGSTTAENPPQMPAQDLAATATALVPVATEAASADTTPAETATASPTLFVDPTNTPSNVDAVDATAIVATTEAGFAPTPTPDASGLRYSNQGETAVIKIMDGTDGPYFASLTMGMTSMEDMQEGYTSYHPLSIYQKTSSGITKISEYDFKDGQHIYGFNLIPTYAEGKAFLTVEGVVGAHSSFGQVFSFDGTTLTLELTTNSDASGGALTMVDVNGDGTLDAVGDATDYYVFCYACGVKSGAEEVSAWDGNAFVRKQPMPSDDATIQAAVTAAEAGRWNIVAATLTDGVTPTNDADTWTVALLKRIVALRAPTADDLSPFMSALLYGDYDAAVGVLKRYQPKALVDTLNPAFPSDLATFGELVVDNVVRLTSTALTQDKTLTSAQFLRGWAQTLLDSKNVAGLADLDAVATADPFYAAVRDAVKSR